MPIGYVYGQLVVVMPDAAGEVAYTAKVFPRSISFATGWMMILAYFIVCPWEAVAVGKIAAGLEPVVTHPSIALQLRLDVDETVEGRPLLLRSHQP